MKGLKALGAWLVSLFVPREIEWFTTAPIKLRTFRRGNAVVLTLPLIAGGAYEVLQATLPAVAAAAGTTVPAELGEVPQQESQATFSVFRADITSPALVTGNNANSATVNLRQMRAGVAVTTNAQALGVFATLALVTGTNLAADVASAMAVTGLPVLLPGDVIDVQVVQIGTGLALPVGTKVQVEVG